MLDLVIANVHLPGGASESCDIGILDGMIAEIAPRIPADAPRYDAGNALAFGGFIESHIHLDKACILDRCAICEGTLAEAVSQTAQAKAAFTEEDVYRRAARVLEKAIVNGTNRLRTFVEVDPRARFASFEAIKAIKRKYAFAIDVSICAFSQDGLTQEMQTWDMLDHCLREGADLVGGCPYTDPDPARHIALIFDLADRHGCDVDFHLDFDLDPEGTLIPQVVAETRRRHYEGRVSIGHVTKLAAMDPATSDAWGAQLADAGIALSVLPATDMFLLGRGVDGLVPRSIAPARRLQQLGVTVSIASNNILNPFTPYGDASLGRMANFYANVQQISRDDDLAGVFEMVTTSAARQIGATRPSLEKGRVADIVLADAADEIALVREIAPVLAGWKRGIQTFSRPRPQLIRPQ